VLVAVRAAGINPSEAAIRTGRVRDAAETFGERRCRAVF
jgi:NADPH:quinone reductase-like Zn-dependent oxidoreductase